MINEIMFDKDLHGYSDDKGSATSISMMFKELGLTEGVDKIPNIAFYQQRGTCAHAALEIYCNGMEPGDGMFEAMMDAEYEQNPLVKWKDIEKYFESGRKLIDGFVHRNWKIAGTEKRFIHRSEIGTYAGTADVLIEHSDYKAIVDWKTGKEIQPTYEIQIAAYAYEEACSRGYIAKLKEDGSVAELVEMNLTTGTEKLVKLLSIYNSDADIETKKEFAKQLIGKRTAIVDPAVGDELVEIKLKIDEKEGEIKELKKTFEEKREAAGLSESSIYANSKYEIKFTYIQGKSERKVNHEKLADALITELSKLGYGDFVSELIEKFTETKTSAPSWRTYLNPVGGSDPETKTDEPKKERKKRETRKTQEVVNESPVKEQSNSDSTPVNFEPEKKEFEGPSTTPASRDVEKTGKSLNEENIEKILAGRGLEKYIETFWLNAERFFKTGRKSGKMNFSVLEDLAKTIRESALIEYKEKFKNGDML